VWGLVAWGVRICGLEPARLLLSSRPPVLPWPVRSFPARFGACGVFNTLAREGWGGRRNVLRMRRISRVARCGDAGKSEKGLWNLREKFPKISLDFSDLLCYNSSC